MRWDVPLKLFIIRCNFSSFSLAKSQPRDLQIMVYSCAMSPNFAWRQIIFCCRVYETTLFSFLLSQSCVKMADRFASQRYSLKIKLGDRMIKHQYWTQLSQNILMTWTRLYMVRDSEMNDDCRVGDWRPGWHTSTETSNSTPGGPLLTMIPSDFIVKQLLIYHDYAAFSVPDKLPSFFRRYKQNVSF